MLDDLDKSLQALLAQGVAGLDADHIYFDAPDREFAPALPAVNLFLYDVRDNRDLRSNEWLSERRGDSVTRRPAPRRVDCSYLITAWAGDVASEHRLLGQVMRALLRAGSIPAPLLRGSLAQPEQPLPTSLLQPGNLQSLGELWQALDGKPRAVLNYTVTISVDVGEAVDFPIVKGRTIRIEQGIAQQQP